MRNVKKHEKKDQKKSLTPISRFLNNLSAIMGSRQNSWVVARSHTHEGMSCAPLYTKGGKSFLNSQLKFYVFMFSRDSFSLITVIKHYNRFRYTLFWWSLIQHGLLLANEIKRYDHILFVLAQNKLSAIYPFLMVSDNARTTFS